MHRIITIAAAGLVADQISRMRLTQIGGPAPDDYEEVTKMSHTLAAPGGPEEGPALVGDSADHEAPA